MCRQSSLRCRVTPLSLFHLPPVGEINDPKTACTRLAELPFAFPLPVQSSNPQIHIFNPVFNPFLKKHPKVDLHLYHFKIRMHTNNFDIVLLFILNPQEDIIQSKETKLDFLKRKIKACVCFSRVCCLAGSPPRSLLRHLLKAQLQRRC